MLEKLKKILKDYSSILLNVLASFVVKGGSLVVTTLTTPAYIRYFNDNLTLGVWYTILSVLQAILTLDIGVGNGLRNKLTVALVKKDDNEASKLISSAYAVILAVVGALALASIFVFDYLPWHKFLGIELGAVDGKVLALSMKIVFCGVMLQLALKLINSILYAMQKSALNNLLLLLSSVVILLYVAFAPSRSQEQNLLTMSAVNVLAVNLPLLVATVCVFCGKLRKSRPKIRNVRLNQAKTVMGSGMKFFYLQIAFMFISALNEYLISNICGPQYTVNYQVYQKVFGLVTGMLSLALMPIWSSVTKAQAQKDYGWIKRLYNMLCVIALIIAAASFVLVPLMEKIVNVWIGKDVIQVTTSAALIFCISNMLFLWHNVNTTVANGLSFLKPQFIWLTVGAVAKIPVAYLCYHMIGDWTAVVLANVIVLMPLTIAQPIMLRKYLKDKSAQSEESEQIQE